MNKRTCNQCHTNMDYSVESKAANEIIASICTNPECMNYALLQMAAELMPLENEVTKPI